MGPEQHILKSGATEKTPVEQPNGPCNRQNIFIKVKVGNDQEMTQCPFIHVDEVIVVLEHK